MNTSAAASMHLAPWQMGEKERGGTRARNIVVVTSVKVSSKGRQSERNVLQCSI